LARDEKKARQIVKTARTENIQMLSGFAFNF